MPLSKSERSGILFVAITIIWTWGVLAIPVVFGMDFENNVTKVSYILAGASPSVIGLTFLLVSEDRIYIRSFLKRLITLGNSSAIVLLAVFTLVPAITLISAYASFLITSVNPDFFELVAHSKDLTGLMLFAVFTFVFGPLAEEIGWRGYLMDCWKPKGILVYGVGIGLIWTLWHLPMFFIEGTYQNSLLLKGAIPIICFALSTIALGVIIGYITKRTGSILPAILFHFSINFTGEIIPLELTGEIINTIILLIIASGIIYMNPEKRSKCNEPDRNA